MFLDPVINVSTYSTNNFCTNPPLTNISASELTGSTQSDTYAIVIVGTAVNAKDTMPYPKNRLVQCRVSSTPNPNTRHPAPVISIGSSKRYSLFSGSNKPLFFLVR